MSAPEHTARNLLRKAHTAESASAIFKERVLRKPLILRPTSPAPNSQDARQCRRNERIHKQLRSRRKQKPKSLSAKEKRVSGIYDVKKDNRKYEIYVPLHDMWQGYMQEILGLHSQSGMHVTAQSAGSKLASAEFHGAHLRIVRSRCAGMVGLEGIVIRDTKFTFQIITARNELKSVWHCLFPRKIAYVYSHSQTAYHIQI